MVIVCYTFYEEYTYNDLGEENTKVFEEFIKQEYEPNIKIGVLVRGSDSEKIKDRTSLQPNYVSLDFLINQYDPKKLFTILGGAGLLPE